MVLLGKLIILLLLAVLLFPLALSAGTTCDTITDSMKVWDNGINNRDHCDVSSPCAASCQYANQGDNTRMWIGTRDSTGAGADWATAHIGCDITYYVDNAITLDSAFFEAYLDSYDDNDTNLIVAVHQLKENKIVTNWKAYGDTIHKRDGECFGCDDVGGGQSCGDSSATYRKRVATDTASSAGTAWDVAGGVGTDEILMGVVDITDIPANTVNQYIKIKVTNCMKAAIDSAFTDYHDADFYVADFIVHDSSYHGHFLTIHKPHQLKSSKRFITNESASNKSRFLMYYTVDDAAIDDIHSPAGAGTIRSKEPSLIHRP